MMPKCRVTCAVRGKGYQLIPRVHRRSPAQTAERRAAAIRSPFTEGPRSRFSGDASLVEGLDLTLPAQPSIVILPFGVAEPSSRNLARGLTHDITTRIGRSRQLFVIARGTAFQFSHGHHDVAGVGAKLGVRYVVQGYVQCAGGYVTITVDMADAVNRKEVWSESYRRKIDGIFSVHEEIADLIAGTIQSEVEQAEQRSALLNSPASLDAWSAYHRGCWHMYRFTPHDFEQAERFFNLSVRLDPNSPRAFAGLSFVHWQRAFLELTPDRTGEIDRAFDLAQQNIALDSRDPLGHWALGRAQLLRNQMDASIAELATATALNPSFAVGQYTLGFVLMQAGDTVQSLGLAGKAQRLSPYDPFAFAMLSLRALSLTLRGAHEQGAAVAARAARQPNAHYHIFAAAALCDALARRAQSARHHSERLAAGNPGYSERDFFRAFPFQLPEHVALLKKAFRFLDRLR